MSSKMHRERDGEGGGNSVVDGANCKDESWRGPSSFSLASSCDKAQEPITQRIFHPACLLIPIADACIGNSWNERGYLQPKDSCSCRENRIILSWRLQHHNGA